MSPTVVWGLFTLVMIGVLVFFMAMMWFKPKELGDLMTADRRHKEELAKLGGKVINGAMGVVSRIRKK